MNEEVLVTPLEKAVDIESVSFNIDTDEPVVVYTSGSGSDGEIVRGILESEGIPTILTQPASPALGMVFGAGAGQAGEILVAPRDAARAVALVAAYSVDDENGLTQVD